MKKIITCTIALLSICSASFAQNSPKKVKQPQQLQSLKTKNDSLLRSKKVTQSSLPVGQLPEVNTTKQK